MQIFSERLRSLLPHGKKGKLADFCGVEASTVTRWLKGESFPTGEGLFKIAAFLGVDAKWLMDGDNPPFDEELSTSPKHPGIGESANEAYALKEDPSHFRATLDPVAAAFAKIREGLDMLEQLMKNLPP